MRQLLFLLALLFHINVYGQNSPSLFRKLITPDTSLKKGFTFNFDNRYSFVKDSAVNIYGFSLGYRFHKRHQAGIGFYRINSSYFIKNRKDKQNLGSPSEILNDIQVRYITPNYLYTFYKGYRTELIIPFEFGFGTIERAYLNLKTHEIRPPKTKFFSPVEVGILGLFKVNRWVGLKASVGYRKVIFTKENFDGLYYSYGVLFFLGNIVHDLR